MKGVLSIVIFVSSRQWISHAFVIQPRWLSPPTRRYASSDEDGLVGSGPNWIERSFPVHTETIDPKQVDDYNMGVSGVSLQVGLLSAQMYDAIVSRSSLERASDEIRRAYKLYAMDFTAKEAARAALKQNGLELVLNKDEEDEGMWADVDTIRLLDNDGNPLSRLYDSWEEAVDDWTPGQGFDFVARQVPAKMRELTLDELLGALDPDGSLRKQAKDAGMSLPGEEIASLKDMATENVRRTEAAPRAAVSDEEAFRGDLSSRGYQPVKASDLTYDSMNADGTENRRTLMHVMDALVSHGCVIVDLTDEGGSFSKAVKMAKMWNVAESFFEKVEKQDLELVGMQTIQETGSRHAKAGFASYDNGSLQFFETRQTRAGELLPKEAVSVLSEGGCNALKDAFATVASVGKDIVRIAVAASSMEAGALQGATASEAAYLLANEILDDSNPLQSDITHSEGSVSMSPHRLCCYSNIVGNNVTANASSVREVFGAHTDSTFITAVPVAAVAGLEVYDEAANKWYRPELAAREHWQAEQRLRGGDPDATFHLIDSAEYGSIPWHARYIIMMPGELLQLVTRNEIDAAVHRVVAGDGGSRLSAPILLRGRPGLRLDAGRYLGGVMSDQVLNECNGMTIEEIHDKMQPGSFQ